MKKTYFKRLAVVHCFTLLFSSASYCQVPQEKRPEIPRPVGCFDISSNMSEEELKATVLERIANGEIYEAYMLEEKPQPVPSAAAKKAKATFTNNPAVKKLKTCGINFIAQFTVEKDGAVSEINVFQTDTPEINEDKEVKDIKCIFGDPDSYNPESPWRELTLETCGRKYAWVSKNKKVNDAVISYIKKVKWTIGKLYGQPTRTNIYYVLP